MVMRFPLGELQFCYLLDTSEPENLQVFIGGVWLSRSRQGIIGGISVVLKSLTDDSDTRAAVYFFWVGEMRLDPPPFREGGKWWCKY